MTEYLTPEDLQLALSLWSDVRFLPGKLLAQLQETQKELASCREKLEGWGPPRPQVPEPVNEETQEISPFTPGMLKALEESWEAHKRSPENRSDFQIGWVNDIAKAAHRAGYRDALQSRIQLSRYKPPEDVNITQALQPPPNNT